MNVYSHMTIMKIKIKKSSFLLRISLGPFVVNPQPLATTHLLSIPKVLPLKKCHVSGIIWYMVFCVQLSVSVMNVKLINIVWISVFYLLFQLPFGTLQEKCLEVISKGRKPIKCSIYS